MSTACGRIPHKRRNAPIRSRARVLARRPIMPLAGLVIFVMPVLILCESS